jgi:glycosyltransferase involved in cell wall biosynthesis
MEKRRQKPKNRLFEKLALQNADGVIAPNNFTLDITKRVFHLENFRKILIRNLGIDLCQFFNPDIDNYQPNTVYCIGTLIRKKGIFYLPSIFEEILKSNPEVNFFLIGNDSPDIFSGSLSTWALLEKEFSPQVKESTTYLGKINYEEIVEHLSKANVCIFPSQVETTGMVTLEAMAMGKSVVTSDEPWAKEIITSGENGMIENPQDSKKFAKTVIQLLNSPEEVSKIGREARKKIESEFDSKKIALDNLEFYQSFFDS